MDNCDIFHNVLNITDACQTSVLGTTIETPCVELCMGALSYAIIRCRSIYIQSDLYDKIKHLLYICGKSISH